VIWVDLKIHDLGTVPGGIDTHAQDINERGQVVGVAVTAAGFQAFLWDAGTMIVLNDLGGGDREAHGINNLGQIAGLSRIGSGDVHAALWTRH
jgi:probable HAF family extracellular repeat protein